ncbi:hypothetical protein DFJ63DRAFT_337869 [Scheffersomyces coipomensis]|uniref:uncharacterized protein n=1 Tax=Scheffersomyces coipomensis TaxID=1788519 RepID=UPI00315C8557
MEDSRETPSSGSGPFLVDGDDNSNQSSTPLNYQEQLRQQTIINSMENKDYLLVIASQQQKSVQQLTEGS